MFCEFNANFICFINIHTHPLMKMCSFINQSSLTGSEVMFRVSRVFLWAMKAIRCAEI